MSKTRTWITIAVIVIVLVLFGLYIASPWRLGSGSFFESGYYVRTEAGNHVLMIRDSDKNIQYIFMTELDKKENLFGEFQTGDKIKIAIASINTDQMPWTVGVYMSKRLKKQTPDTIAKIDFEKISELEEKYNRHSVNTNPKVGQLSRQKSGLFLMN